MILLFILVWGMFAGWVAHLLLARNQPIDWAELLVVGLAGVVRRWPAHQPGQRGWAGASA